jgi:lipoprotein-releasing system permease protein
VELDPVNYFVNYVPIDVTASTIIIINIVAFAFIMLAMLVPCMFISKVSPAKTIVVD